MGRKRPVVYIAIGNMQTKAGSREVVQKLYRAFVEAGGKRFEIRDMKGRLLAVSKIEFARYT